MPLPRKSCQIQGSTPRAQSGAALLVFMLLIVVSASTLLITKLNASIKLSVYSPDTGIALKEARQALTAWAVNHPFNPGTLPMPDRNGDGNYDGDADCFNGTITASLLLGKLPWRDYPSPCRDAAGLDGLSIFAADRSGEQLWYAVSKNLVYESPDYPFISPGLLHKTTDWITVRNVAGNIISDRVAFVVIAPGSALAPYADCDGLSYTGQVRNGTAPGPENYLDSVIVDTVTYSNADYDQDFIMYPNSAVTNSNSTLDRCDQFNDQLVFVTIDELLGAVSKRVLNETAHALTAYHITNDSMPWLVPFADPKSDTKALRGEVTSSGSDLTDTSVDFTEWNVTNGDTVWNLTDGSRGIVTSVSVNTLTIGSGLRFGNNNTFVTDDEYYVEVRYMTDILIETASGGSSGNTLVDSGRDFEMLDVVPGDVIENLDDGSTGIISDVDGDEISTSGLTGGTDNEFSSGDSYRIRTNSSRITGTTANLILTDTNVDFIAMGVQVGDVVHNLWDQTISSIASIDSATQLTVDALKLGTGVVFNQNEPYQISRYNSRENTRIGLLPVHQSGELIPTGFSVDWYSPSSGGSISTSPYGSANDTTYSNTFATLASSSLPSGSLIVNATNAKCLWLSDELVNCEGVSDYLERIATSGSSGVTLYDTTTNFPSVGVKRGDLLVDNVSRMGIVSSLSGNTRINAAPITTNPASPAVNFSANNPYRIKIATSQRSGTASSHVLYNSTSKTFRVTIPNASGIQIGDTIENTDWTYGGGIGRIVGVSGNQITASELIGGPVQDIFTGESFIIHYNFIEKREYTFDITIKATMIEQSVNNVRKRTVCRGYNVDCTTAANNAVLKGNGSTAFVTVRDYEEGITNAVAVSSNTLPTAGLSNRSLKVSGLDFYLDDEYGDLPEWFVRNKWYQYVMVAYTDGDGPGGTTCVAGTDCLTLNMKNAASTTIGSKNDVRALVMVAKGELSGQSWAAAAATDYFDDTTNTNLDDDIFDKHPESGSFNDLIRIAVSCPSPDEEELCWSN